MPLKTANGNKLIGFILYSDLLAKLKNLGVVHVLVAAYFQSSEIGYILEARLVGQLFWSHKMLQKPSIPFLELSKKAEAGCPSKSVGMNHRLRHHLLGFRDSFSKLLLNFVLLFKHCKGWFKLQRRVIELIHIYIATTVQYVFKVPCNFI